MQACVWLLTYWSFLLDNCSHVTRDRNNETFINFSTVWSAIASRCRPSVCNDMHYSYYGSVYIHQWAPPLSKLKRLELLMTLHLRDTECHLPYRITVLPATWHKWTHPALTPASGRYSINIPHRDERLSWPGQDQIRQRLVFVKNLPRLGVEMTIVTFHQSDDQN